MLEGLKPGTTVTFSNVELPTCTVDGVAVPLAVGVVVPQGWIGVAELRGVTVLCIVKSAALLFVFMQPLLLRVMDPALVGEGACAVPFVGEPFAQLAAVPEVP